jgi:ABC-type dipeptide/oligopeptide/nickel transport system permease subunit
MEGAMITLIAGILFAVVGYAIGQNLGYNAGYLDGLRGQWRRSK